MYAKDTLCRLFEMACLTPLEVHLLYLRPIHVMSIKFRFKKRSIFIRQALSALLFPKLYFKSARTDLCALEIFQTSYVLLTMVVQIFVLLKPSIHHHFLPRMVRKDVRKVWRALGCLQGFKSTRIYLFLQDLHFVGAVVSIWHYLL